MKTRFCIPRVMRNERGSALVLVTLVSLVLAALAIVALRNIARSVHQTAVYQTRLQSLNTSASAMGLVSRRTGDKASLVYNRMKQGMYSNSTVGGNTDSGVLGGSATESARLNTVLAGNWVIYDGHDFDHMYETPTGNGETGLFTDGTEKSFEHRRGKETHFRAIIRDPIESSAATGFSSNYCFKKVTMVAEATVGAESCDEVVPYQTGVAVNCTAPDTCRGETPYNMGYCDTGWKKVNTVSQTRSGVEGMIGPIECGY